MKEATTAALINSNARFISEYLYFIYSIVLRMIMVTKNQLQRKITPLDGKDYGAFQSLIGTYDFGQFAVIIDQIPKDPYAPPHTGIYRIQFPIGDMAIEDDMLDTRIGEIACRDFYARHFFNSSTQIAGKRRGTGNSGIITAAVVFKLRYVQRCSVRWR